MYMDSLAYPGQYHVYGQSEAQDYPALPLPGLEAIDSPRY